MPKNRESIFSYKNGVPFILITYFISLMFSVFMYSATNWLRFVFAAVSFLGYIAIIAVIIVKIVDYFKNKGKRIK